MTVSPESSLHRHWFPDRCALNSSSLTSVLRGARCWKPGSNRATSNGRLSAWPKVLSVPGRLQTIWSVRVVSTAIWARMPVLRCTQRAGCSANISLPWRMTAPSSVKTSVSSARLTRMRIIPFLPMPRAAASMLHRVRSCMSGSRHQPSLPSMAIMKPASTRLSWLATTAPQPALRPKRVSVRSQHGDLLQRLAHVSGATKSRAMV